ncbi:hypothetical protein [Fredinandcohnia quinoae]|uniref:Uncharacterized protein n=1 Tax=Fredinandcohnia quinoae TaxID=2918902 RepID=A0AAW5E8B5_9BACI|nr:hypothetical protein [Fredinandcohnia sp. SECRCQ15]MCH1625383.1 hypothetical protein [Fredinandcohnia sp. SECRCQ15]
MENAKSRKLNWIAYVSVLFLVMLIGIKIGTTFFSTFQLTFILFPLMVCAIIGASILMIISVIHIIKKRSSLSIMSFIPTCINLVFFLILLYQPISTSLLQIEFAIKKDSRMDIVEQFNEGKLEPSNDYLYKIPTPYNKKFISDGNEIFQRGDFLFFYHTRGVIDNFSGYVYNPSGNPPTSDDVQADIIYMKKMNSNWYYVSCT